MKLYVKNKISRQNIYLNVKAATRQQLANKIGSYSFFIDGTQYHVNEVFAEKEINNTVTGAAVGSLVGAVGGPIGVFVGGIIGGAIGNSSDDQELNLVRKFNFS